MGLYDKRRTARLLLTRVTRADFDDLLAMYRDPRVMATLGGLQPEAELLRRAELLLKNWDDHGFGLWTMREVNSGTFVGRGGLRRVTLENRLETEVAYALTPEFWGQGLATELANEAVRVAFAEIELADLI